MGRNNKSIDMDKFSSRLQEVREKMSLSQKEAAERIGAVPSTWSQWERGKRTPPLYVLLAIAYRFNTSVDYLSGHSDVSEPLDNEAYLKSLSDADRDVFEEYLALNDKDKSFIKGNIEYLKNRDK